MNDPQISCSKCGTEIKLTESLAAPLIAAARKQFEAQLEAKEADFGRREARLQQTQADLAKAREAIDEQVAARLKAERAGIAENEARKARLALADDLVERDRQLADLQELLKANNAKLGEAQKTQAEMLRKERALDDAQREVELTVEKKVQAALTAVRVKAKVEAEDALNPRSPKRRPRSPACSARSKNCAAKRSKALSSCRAKPLRSNLNPCCAADSKVT